VIVPLSLAAGGMIVASLAQSNLLILVALAVSLVGTLAYNGPFFMLPSTFLGGTAAAAGIGFVNFIGSFGRFLGPYSVGVLKEATGGYAAPMAALAVAMLMSALIVLGLGRIMAMRKVRYS
jgi:ACS family tartrate transporter-like MFS transporter